MQLRKFMGIVGASFFILSPSLSRSALFFKQVGDWILIPPTSSAVPILPRWRFYGVKK
jgi:hypothetical protein